MPSRLQVALVVAAGFGFGTSLWADDAAQGPGRGVARISVINGDVSVRRGDSGDLIAAAINSPLVVEDRVLTGPAARAEVQFDWANMIRLSHDAEIRLAELEYKRYIVQVARGTVTFRVLRDQDADVEVSTPSVSVRPVKRGAYRVTVHDDGTSEITVRSGEAEIFTPKGSERLRSGKTMIARGTAAEPEFRVAGELPDDEWDSWNQRRDRDLERTRSYSYVSPDIYGAEDLDGHGSWVQSPGYGTVWAPRVAPGWAPYRNGRWSWIDYYGWSWVSYDPWGWAPYHYGRWLYSAPFGWCWWPGSRSVRHYWSPGLVAFFGVGPARFGLGFGNVGWVPLAPFERYYPWYGRGFYGGYRNGRFGNNVRIVNNVNITNVYRNARVDRSVTIVDQDGFRRGRSGSAARGDSGFSRASAFQGQLPMTPGRESLRLADRDPSVRPVAGRDSDRFFSRRQPAQVDRISFEDQRRGMAQATRTAFADESRRPVGSRVAAAETAAPEVGDSGWRRVGEEGTRRGSAESPSRREGAPQGGVDESAWRRFGSPRIDGAGDARTGRGDRNGNGQFGQPAGSEQSGWRRIGEGRGGSDSPQVSSERASEPSSDWRPFSGRGDRSSNDGESSGRRSGRGDGGSREAPASADSFNPGDRQVSPRAESRSEPRNWEPRGGSDAVQISPPIVRERGIDRSFSGGRSGGRSGDGEGRGAQRSAPSMQAAPRGNGGDGGGGGRGAGSRDGGGGGGSPGGGRSGRSR